MADIFFRGSKEPLKVNKIEFTVDNDKGFKETLSFPFPRNHEFKLEGTLPRTWETDNFLFGRDSLQ